MAGPAVTQFEVKTLDVEPGERQRVRELTVEENAAEGVMVLMPRMEGGLGLGLLVEYEHPAAAPFASRKIELGSELRSEPARAGMGDEVLA